MYRKARKQCMNKVEIPIDRKGIKKENKKKLQNWTTKMTEMKNSVDGFIDRFEQVEKRINELKDRTIDIIDSEEQKKKMIKSEQNLRDLWDTIRSVNICQHIYWGVPEKEKGANEIFGDIMAENLSDLIEHKSKHLRSSRSSKTY